MQLDTVRSYSLPGWGPILELRSKLPLLAEGAATTWIHCAVVGEWKGHHNGEFEFSTQAFREICHNFDRHKNPIPLTYEHPEYSMGEPVRAAGWVRDFAVREDGLWAFCEFTERATELIRAGEYRYCSVVVLFESKDRKSGEPCGAEIFEIGLTNSPFIDGLTPIRLSRGEALRAGVHSMATKTEKADTDALVKEAKKRAGEDATPRKFLEVLQALVEFEEKMSGAGGEPEPPKEGEAAAASVPASRQGGDDDEAATKLTEQVVQAADPVAGAAAEAMALLEQALGLDAAGVLAWLREHASQLPSLIGGTSETADSAFSRTVPREVYDAVVEELRLARESEGKLESESSENAEQKAQREAEEKVDALVKNNRLTGFKSPEQRATFVKLARTQPKQFAEFVDALPPRAVPTERVSAHGREQVAATQLSHGPNVVKLGDELVDITPRDESEVALVHMSSNAQSAAKNLARYRANQAARSL